MAVLQRMGQCRLDEVLRERKLIIVSAADSAFFPLVLDLVDSVRDRPELDQVALGVIDVGLTDDERRQLDARGVALRDGEWHVEQFIDEEHPHFRAYFVRAFLPSYFQGYDDVMWADADLWVQDWRAVAVFAAISRAGGLACGIEYHLPVVGPSPCVGSYLAQSRTYWYEANRRVYGRRLARYLARFPGINAGMFCAAADSQFWSDYQTEIALAAARLRGLNGKPNGINQPALNKLVWLDQFPTVVLPASVHHVVDHDIAPVFDPATKRFVDPRAPYIPLGALHLIGAGRDGTSDVLRTRAVGDASHSHSLLYRANRRPRRDHPPTAVETQQPADEVAP